MKKTTLFLRGLLLAVSAGLLLFLAGAIGHRRIFIRKGIGLTPHGPQTVAKGVTMTAGLISSWPTVKKSTLFATHWHRESPYRAFLSFDATSSNTTIEVLEMELLSNTGSINLVPLLKVQKGQGESFEFATTDFELDFERIDNLRVKTHLHIKDEDGKTKESHMTYTGKKSIRKENYWWLTHEVQSR